jgi:hypothetical protein
MRLRLPEVARLEPLRAMFRPFFVSVETRLSRVVGTPAIYAIAVGAIA